MKTQAKSWPCCFSLFLTEPDDSPLKMDTDSQHRSEQCPGKTKLPVHVADDILPCPSKQKKQRQNVKAKLENLSQLKDHEFTRRRPVRRASRKNYFPDTLIVFVSDFVIILMLILFL